MRNSPKVVVSKKLKSVGEEPNWKNITILHEIGRDAAHHKRRVVVL